MKFIKRLTRDIYPNKPYSKEFFKNASKEDVEKYGKFTVLAESEEAGYFILLAEGGKNIFVLGHPEYDRMTLDNEYKRDIGKGLEIDIPKNYYPKDDPTQKPILSWRAHANTLYSNWLNYYVYQVTPYEL